MNYDIQGGFFLLLIFILVSGFKNPLITHSEMAIGYTLFVLYFSICFFQIMFMSKGDLVKSKEERE